MRCDVWGDMTSFKVSHSIGNPRAKNDFGDQVAIHSFQNELLITCSMPDFVNRARTHPLTTAEQKQICSLPLWSPVSCLIISFYKWDNWGLQREGDRYRCMQGNGRPCRLKPSWHLAHDSFLVLWWHLLSPCFLTPIILFIHLIYYLALPLGEESLWSVLFTDAQCPAARIVPITYLHYIVDVQEIFV